MNNELMMADGNAVVAKMWGSGRKFCQGDKTNINTAFFKLNNALIRLITEQSYRNRALTVPAYYKTL